jgi:hypothetical protein
MVRFPSPKQVMVAAPFPTRETHPAEYESKHNQLDWLQQTTIGSRRQRTEYQFLIIHGRGKDGSDERPHLVGLATLTLGGIMVQNDPARLSGPHVLLISGIINVKSGVKVIFGFN